MLKLAWVFGFEIQEICGILLREWAILSLGRAFTVVVEVNPGQSLVTSGPYRWVRHPMYTALFLVTVVYFLISANWFIGMTWIGWIVGTVASTVRDEEAVLVAKFGDEYQAYMRRTRRFLPRVW